MRLAPGRGVVVCDRGNRTGESLLEHHVETEKLHWIAMIPQLRSPWTAPGSHLAQVLRRGAPKADEVVAGGGAPAVVAQPARHAERLDRVVVARPADHHPTGRARVGLPALIRPARIRA